LTSATSVFATSITPATMVANTAAPAFSASSILRMPSTASGTPAPDSTRAFQVERSMAPSAAASGPWPLTSPMTK